MGNFSYTCGAGFFFFFSFSSSSSSFLGTFSYISRAGFFFNLGSFSYTAHACFICSGEILLHVPRTSRAGFFFLFFFFFCLNPGSSSSTSHTGFIFIWGVSLTHPVLASFLFGEFLLHIPCWFHLYLASFSYTSHAPASFSAFFFFF